jgi:hypothetical protein
MNMLCSQCGMPAERCERCAGALCARIFCSELHEASCAAVSTLPAQPMSIPTAIVFKPKVRRRERDAAAERIVAEQLVLRISQHRQAGRAALLVGDLDTAFDELWAARALEPDLDRLGPTARECMPHDWEIETDLTPLARTLSSSRHPRAADAWRRLLEDRPARSIQAEAADWLAQEALAAGDRRGALRLLHAASLLGRPSDAEAFLNAYRQAGIDPAAAFNLYLAASRVDPRTARALGLKDPLTEAPWPDQDPRWWVPASASSAGHAAAESTDHQADALSRARDLVHGKRAEGWLMLAEGDHAAGPLGVRSIARNVRAGCAEAADEDAFLRIRLAYEGAAERLPDVAWPWYRLAELLAWAGFGDRAAEHLAQAEKRGLGDRTAERSNRPLLRALVQAGLGNGPDGLPTATRPFPAEPYEPQLGWRMPFLRFARW